LHQLPRPRIGSAIERREDPATRVSSTARWSGKTCSVVALGAVAGVVRSVNVVPPYSL
jgi:hypothetical protein